MRATLVVFCMMYVVSCEIPNWTPHYTSYKIRDTDNLQALDEFYELSWCYFGLYQISVGLLFDFSSGVLSLVQVGRDYYLAMNRLGLCRIPQSSQYIDAVHLRQHYIQ